MFKTNLAEQHPAKSYHLQLAHGKRLLLDRPHVMGIVNLAPDSFSAKARYSSPTAVLDYVEQIIADGVDIIDLGAEPTNPNLDLGTAPELELQRLLPVLGLLTQHIRLPISIDTSQPLVMKACIEMGAHMINDVRGLRVPGALTTAFESGAAVCIMHMLYPYELPESGLTFDDPEWLLQIKTFLEMRALVCQEVGFEQERLLMDPGIGYGRFGKSTLQNCLILQNLAFFQDLGYPLLIGASRKTFIGDLLNVSEDNRISGSVAAAVVAALQGTHMIRVHDVKETVDAITVARAIIDART